MTSKKDLSNIREQIDKIDSELLELINKRGAFALEVSKHKKANSLRIYDPGREKEIENKLIKNNTDYLNFNSIKFQKL